MANTSNGKQQISTYYGKDLRSLYANQELFGLVQPGAYKTEIVPVIGGSGENFVSFIIKAGSVFVFQDTSEEDVGGGQVPFVVKVVLNEDAQIIETTISSLPASNIVISAQWTYSSNPSSRYASFIIEAYTNETENFVPNTSTLKMNKVPIAIIKNINRSENFSYNFAPGVGQAIISYLEFNDKLDLFTELTYYKNPFNFVYIKPSVSGPGIIALTGGKALGPNGIMSVEWYAVNGTTKQSSPMTALLSTSNVTTSTYYSLDGLLNKDFVPGTSIFTNHIPSGDDANYINKANYGYTWTSVPDSGSLSSIDVVMLLPATANDIHESTYAAMTSRPKLRIFRSEFPEDLTPGNEAYDRIALKNNLLSKIANKILTINAGIIICFIIRGVSETGFSTKNILPWTHFIPNMGGLPSSRLFIPIIEE